MNKQDYKKVTFEFPAEEYLYLKLACVKQGVSIKEFITKAVLRDIHEYEDELDTKAFQEEYTEENIKNAISLDELDKIMGWDESK